MIRLLIVVSMRLFREGLGDVLAQRAEVEVVGLASDLVGVEQAAQAGRANVALVEASLADFLGAPRRLARLTPPIPVVALGGFDTECEVIESAEAGIAGYVTREESVDDLVSALECAARHEIVCSPRITAALVRRVAAVAGTRRTSSPDARLTGRELDVLQLIDEGLSNKQIALRLHIELSTVKNHVHNILEKLQVARRAEAVRLVRTHGLLALLVLAT
jgi:DNA-binding NarL/FixJ family response regulator